MKNIRTYIKFLKLKELTPGEQRRVDSINLELRVIGIILLLLVTLFSLFKDWNYIPIFSLVLIVAIFKTNK